jgi:hypothetical protein
MWFIKLISQIGFENRLENSNSIQKHEIDGMYYAQDMNHMPNLQEWEEKHVVLKF